VSVCVSGYVHVREYAYGCCSVCTFMYAHACVNVLPVTVDVAIINNVDCAAILLTRRIETGAVQPETWRWQRVGREFGGYSRGKQQIPAIRRCCS